MRNITSLIVKIILFLVVSITCTKDPAGPDISDDLKPKGTITGYIYDMWNRPLKDVLVSVDADSAVPGVSKETGLFTVGKVMEGTYVLRFTHRDYDNDSSYIVTVEQGVDDTLTDTVRLSYAYYILKGRIVYNTSPVPGAGVSAAGYPLSTLTDETGTYVLDKIPKTPSLKLICAKSGLGFNTHSSITGIEDDTTRIGDIPLLFKGATVSGTVYDTSGAPVRNEIVAAVGGGLIDTTNSDGEYVIENIPCNESSVRIYVLTSDSLFYGATSGINVKDTSIVPNVDIHLRPTSDLENGNGMAIQVFDMVIVDTISAVQLTVYPWTDVHTVIHSFMWSLKGQEGSRNDTTKDAFLSLTKNDLNSLAGSAGSRNISVGVHARNTEGGLSQKQYFTVMIRTFAPMISAGGSPTEGGTPQDSVSIEVNETVYFTAEIDDPFGGIDTIEWDFGDSTPKWYSTDGLANVGHAFPKEGTCLSVLRVKDTDGNEARDTVTVEVSQSPLDPPQNISPPDYDTVWTMSNNATLLWHKVTSSQAVLYDVYLDSLNDPAGILYKPDVSDTSLLVTVRKDKTYHWKIVAKSGGNTSTGKTWTFTVKSSDTTNHAPSFTDSTGSMTGFATVGKEYKDTLHANDPDGDTLSFSFIESPGGMSLTDSIITWIPAIADTGEKSVIAQVSDGKGGLDSLSWNVFVGDTGSLVAHWSFDNQNDPLIDDVADNNGINNGAVWIGNGQINGAMRLNENSYIEIPDSDSSNFNLKDTVSVSFWVRIDGNINSSPGYMCNLFGKGVFDDPRKGYWGLSYEPVVDDQPPSAFHLEFQYLDNEGIWCPFGKGQVAYDRWQHLGLTFDGSEARLFINGRWVETAHPPVGHNYLPRIAGHSSYINSINQSNRGMFDIDNLKIYNRMLSDSEMMTIFQDGITGNEAPYFLTGMSMYSIALVGKEYSDTLHAVDLNGDILTFSLLESPAGMSLTDSTITWTPAISDTGVNSVTAQVSDGNGGFDSLSWTITVFNSIDSVMDADGNVYHAVTIGSQVWTIENLRTTKYNDSTDIPNVTDSATWFNLSTGAYCYYDNTSNVDSIKKYGALYNWYTINTEKLAPTGWHVPDSADWEILQNYLIANGYNWDGTTTGNKIAKSMTTKTGWASSSVEGNPGNDMSSNNTSGFSALPGGYRINTDNFVNQSYRGHWWSASENDASSALDRSLNYDHADLGMDPMIKSCGFSVRLVRD